eukprot:9294449-Alexandrium_andersonii.AAC.1
MGCQGADHRAARLAVAQGHSEGQAWQGHRRDWRCLGVGGHRLCSRGGRGRWEGQGCADHDAQR